MRPLTRYPAILLLFMALFGLWGCSDSASPTAPSGTATLTPEVTAAMAEAIQDEYHAEHTYEGVLDDFGNVLPFFNIVNAEERHSSVIARLYQNRGLAVPETQWSLDNVPRFRSVQRACDVAAQAEIANIGMYDRLLALTLPNDVENVFRNNRAASLQNHLPAFQACPGPLS